jgi:hypothetical protein
MKTIFFLPVAILLGLAIFYFTTPKEVIYPLAQETVEQSE